MEGYRAFPFFFVAPYMGTVRLTLDWRVLSFSAGVTIAATLTFGLAPRAARIATRAAGWAARSRAGHSGRAQPLVPALAHRHRDGPRGGAADERHRGSHHGGAGVDCLSGPSGALVRR